MDYKLKEIPQDASLALVIDVINTMGLTLFGRAEGVQKFVEKHPELVEPAIKAIIVPANDLKRPN